jgi:hypothetical protein
MKIFKKLSILLLILSFQLSLKGQSESSFDTINFKILTNLKENQVLKLRLVSMGCFNTDQRRIEFTKHNNIVTASIFADLNYDIFENAKNGMVDSIIKTKVLNLDDVVFYESCLKKSFALSKLPKNCSGSDHFSLYFDDKESLDWVHSACSNNIMGDMINKIEK